MREGDFEDLQGLPRDSYTRNHPVLHQPKENPDISTKKVKTPIGTCVAAGALVGLGAPTAAAAPPEPFTITETVTEGGVNTFEATGALCDSGTFTDEFVNVAGHPDTTGQFNVWAWLFLQLTWSSSPRMV